MPNLVPDQYLRISIHLLDGDAREFTFEAIGERYEKLLEELK